MTCRYAHHDGSYVLGALSSAERQEFEQHLAGCPECAQSVRELAGLPGLLARVDAGVLVTPPAEEPVPDTLLPRLVREVRRTQRRRAFVGVGVAAAAAVTVAAGSVAVFNGNQAPVAGPQPHVSVTVAGGRPMVPVGQDVMTASVAFASVPWGTRLDLTCSYQPVGEYGNPIPSTYTLVVRTRDGRTQQVATWHSLPGKTMRLSAATEARRADITSLEVRTASGQRVLQLRT
jgi:hypothetical protein